MKKLSLTLAVAFLATALTSISHAIPINGRIDIGAFNSTADVNMATNQVNFVGGLGGFNAQVSNATGDYSGFAPTVVSSTKANYSNFNYSLPFAPVGQTIWQVNATTYFALSSILFVDEGITGNTLSLTGLGTAYLTGKDATPGLWSFSADRNQAAVLFSFSSTTQVPPPAQGVPEGGSSFLMLGAAVFAVGLIARFRR